MISNQRDLQARLTFLWGGIALGFGLLGLRLMQIQVVQNLYYAQAAERNRTQIIRQTAPRGLVFDRNNQVVATNQAVFSLIFMPGKNRDSAYLESLARELSPLIRKSQDEILKILLEAIQEESAIRLAEKLSSKVMFKLSELRPIYSGISIIVEARRFYPEGAFAAHLLGHMGRMDEGSWKNLKRLGYRVDSWIGKAGIEKIFERELRGQDGGIRMEVDVHGRLKRILEKIPWKPGNNLTLTIDTKLQKVAEESLRQSVTKSGAVVALDPRDGSVLALASVPDFDPNLFLTPENIHDSKILKHAPEFNLAVQGSYSPGSTFKIISGAAFLEQGHVNPKERTYCPGYFELGKRVFLCWDPKGHHYQNWIQAMEHSCDVYFYHMGLRTGAAEIEKYERLFGIGQKTTIGLPGETAGRISGPEARHARKMHWHDGDTLNLAIGQGELLVTPLQMAMVAAAVANRGTLWRPRFIDRIQYADDLGVYQYKPEVLGQVPLLDSTWDQLQTAMVKVVEEGTGQAVHIPGLTIGGKTGTAQNPEGEDHAWFVAYAGKENEPARLAVAVLVRHGGHGGVTAAPVAKQIIKAAFGI